MPKVSVYLPDDLADAVRDAQVPVSAICQAALERAVREVTAARGADESPPEGASAVGLFARFTPRARQAVVLANEAARGVPHGFVGTEHVLLGILDEGDNMAIRALDELHVDCDELRTELRASMLPPAGAAPTGHVPFTPRAKRSLELAAKEALALGHNYIGCEHLLLGMLATEEGLASRVLRRLGVEHRTTRMAVVSVLTRVRPPAARATPPPAPAPTSASTDATLARILERLDAIERRLHP
jgi:ATP-dependent Clp protease ATP-binding subunit ClpA/post-segregation antitoxin (ccd killing protein)